MYEVQEKSRERGMVGTSRRSFCLLECPPFCQQHSPPYGMTSIIRDQTLWAAKLMLAGRSPA